MNNEQGGQQERQGEWRKEIIEQIKLK